MQDTTNYFKLVVHNPNINYVLLLNNKQKEAANHF